LVLDLASKDELELRTLMVCDLAQVASCRSEVLSILEKNINLILVYFCSEFSKKYLICFQQDIYRRDHLFEQW
jgi:hypothetical protein